MSARNFTDDDDIVEMVPLVVLGGRLVDLFEQMVGQLDIFAEEVQEVRNPDQRVHPLRELERLVLDQLVIALDHHLLLRGHHRQHEELYSILYKGIVQD